jgi:hypothetical protein
MVRHGILAIFGVVACLSISRGAVAAGKDIPVETIQTGNSLLDLCRHSPDVQAPAGCIGYVDGIVDADAFIWTAIKQPPRLCVRRGVSGPQLAEVVLNYLKAHPEQLDYAAAPQALVAIQRAFPCGSS